MIRCKNESRWIGHALQSVIDHVPNNEVILVDNNSTDNSLAIAQQFQRMTNIYRGMLFFTHQKYIVKNIKAREIKMRK